MEQSITAHSPLFEKLNNNFLFQASLGSKELFHSNLLAWILAQHNQDKQPEALRLFLNQMLNEKIAPTDKLTAKISREENKMDLTVKWTCNAGSWNYLFIENKMKSLPTSAQLKEYDEKIDKHKNITPHKILLTPFASSVQTPAKIPWQNRTYQKDIIFFLTALKAITFEHPDTSFVIEKYREFLTDLMAVFEQLHLGESAVERFRKSCYAFYPRPTKNNNRGKGAVVDEGVMAKLTALRIHDFVLKLTHQKIALLIQEKLGPRAPMITESLADLFMMPGCLFLSSGYSNSSGITDIKLCISDKKRQAVGLQLQGNVLKYVVEVFDKERIPQNIAFAKALLNSENRLWFYATEGEHHQLLSGKGRDKELIIDQHKKIAFNSYGKQFIYLNKDLSDYEMQSIDALTSFMANEVLRVIENLTPFQLLLPE